MGDQGLMIAIISFFALTLAKAFALPSVSLFARCWTWLYSMAAPETERDRRRKDIESELHEEIQDLQAEGYHPAEVALRVLVRVAIGIPADVTWAVCYLPNNLSPKLERGSEALRGSKTPAIVVVSVGLFAMMNVGVWVAQPDVWWREFFVANLGVVGAIVLVSNRQRTWARRITTWGPGAAAAILFAFLLWSIVEQRWYTAPMFGQYMLLFISAMLPLVVAIAVGTEACRVRIFKGRWWPVYVSWLFIAVVSTGAAILLRSEVLLVTWSTVFIGLSGLVIMTFVFCWAAAFICRGATKGTAACMKWAAQGIRNLDK